jgi:hypothetical protein
MKSGYRSSPKRFRSYKHDGFYRCDWCRLAFWGPDSYIGYLRHHRDCSRYQRDCASYRWTEDKEELERPERRRPRWRAIARALTGFKGKAR